MRTNTILKLAALGGAVYVGSKLLKRKPIAKRGVVGPSGPANYQAIESSTNLSFATADRQYKYEEGLVVRPAVLLAGPSQDYVKAKAAAHPEVDFIWTTKTAIAGMSAPTPPSPLDKLPSTTVWAFPIGGILAGQWVKDSGTGDATMNSEMINTAITLASTGDSPMPGDGGGEYPLPPVPTPDA